MKKIFARIGFELSVSDEDYENIQSKINGDAAEQLELCKLFIQNGKLTKNSLLSSMVYEVK